MSNVVRWFKSGGVVLNNFRPLTGEDGMEHHGDHVEHEEDRDMELESQSPKPADLPDVFTVDEAVDKMGFGLFQVLLCMFAGSIWVVEPFEVMILAILSAALKCEWDLDYAEEATITMMVFFGYLVGSPVWGAIADKFGRKRSLLGVVICAFTFGISSTFSPNYYVMLFLRGGVGFSVGGGFLGPAYCSEFLPARTRAAILCLLQIAWAIGSILEAILALVVMTSIDHQPWRWLLGISALPFLVVMMLFPLAPESPRYLVFRGKEDEAKKVLALMAKLNCKSLPSGRLVTTEEKEQLLKEMTQATPNEIVESTTTIVEDDIETNNSNGAINGMLPNTKTVETTDLTAAVSSDNDSDSELLLNEHVQHRQPHLWPRVKITIKNKLHQYYHWMELLFRNGWWKTTLLLWYMWFVANATYYGGTLLGTSLFQNDEHCGLKDDNGTNQDCKVLTKSDYIHIMVATSAEFPGTIWIIVLLLVIGRKKAMAITTLAAAISFGLLFLCLNQNILTVFLFGVRGFATAFFHAVYLYTPEVYPTAVRGFGMSLCASISRVGAMIAPYIAQA
ncbi:putative transporter svop-1 isoform X2 [Dysidea avara]|uniref:putative transporter svop-1 isoform X2 n=1 Tax=Dysidea avara TaxID=196820 RepID=UPI00331D1F13